MDPQIQQAEATLARIRPQFYGDGLSDFDMLLRVRESARVKPFEIGLLAVVFYLLVLRGDWKWGPWVFVSLVVITFLQHRYYRSQQKSLDAVISLFLKHSPRTLDEIEKKIKPNRVPGSS